MAWTVYALQIVGHPEPFYVGCTSRAPARRFIEHGSRARAVQENSARGEAIRAALASGNIVSVSLLELASNEDEALAAEKKWIAYYGRADLNQGPLVNKTDGGKGGLGMLLSEDSRRLMSEKKRGNKINLGRKRPDMVARFSKPVTAFTDQGAVAGHYASAREAASALDLHFASISNCLNGINKSCRNRDGTVYQFRAGTLKEHIAPVIYKGRSNA